MSKLSIAIVLLSIAAGNAQGDSNELAISIVEKTCHLCHGMNGEASNAIYPRLAGQNRSYLVK
ncbi:c-type cytochrome [Candidatus Vondammii sp. HM_W22]|uniref:c-type cytochrome n=1 Tax=Candidatus Vondammii sp. HM_W22 TaxID=2687299 RepID=UPI001F1396D8|nr:hypothetical protein [Candidatus Vondammii sp. HM_W22]